MLVHSMGMVVRCDLLILRLASMHFNAVGGIRYHVLTTVGLAIRERTRQLVLKLLLLLLLEQMRVHAKFGKDSR